MSPPQVALDEKENIIPMLAERWDNLEGNKGYIFYLKKGVKFHNGEPLTADDVFFTFKRATSPEGAAVHSFSNFIDAEKMQVIYAAHNSATAPSPGKSVV